MNEPSEIRDWDLSTASPPLRCPEKEATVQHRDLANCAKTSESLEEPALLDLGKDTRHLVWFDRTGQAS
ncbi:hypothetical protein SAMN05216224_104116 [Thioclava dalianensis]|nr:hypothetical protein SAMN05216224_104116 [Thioclava dalianensis]